MSVPFLDLGAATTELRSEISRAIDDVVGSGRFVLGPQVAAFEREFAAYVGTADCIGVANGLDAIELALRALGIGPGDEVIVPSNTFIATWLAVTRLGATVVPVEPIEETYNLDPARVVDAISDRTRGIIAVHLYGQPADMPALRAIATERGIGLIEDAAQAQGALVDGRRVGGWGDLAAWSFYPGKNLGALGDAGAVTTDRKDLAERVRRLRNYGSDAKYSHPERGFNSRLDEMQAAVLRVKLGHLDAWNERRRIVAATYMDRLAGAVIQLPVVAPRVEPVWHLFVVRTSERDALQRHLAARDVETLIHYPRPPHHQGAYADMAGRLFPISERIHREVLSLPMGPHLTPGQIDQVMDAVLSF